MLRSVLAAYGVNQLMKVIVRRPRPVDKAVETMTELSYPSAHAATSFAAARAVPPLYPAALAMAVSRVVLRVHYTSDIVAGAALGTAVAELADRS
ncbi:MAG: phosphatase PAP2 family protein [Thermoleophilaceae bacterium]|nr:phosphatase PAP2 family protein [Thermoleophilaceae bacterium]